MKKTLLLLFLLIGFGAFSQDTEGAYKFVDDDVRGLWLFTDGFSSRTFYKDSVYIGTMGGPYDVKHNRLHITVVFNDVHPEKIGKEEKINLIYEGENFVDDEGRIWIKQPEISAELSGAYRITGRYTNGKFSKINHSGTRITLKMLIDGYFQWIAYDSGTKQFFGTGGGDYTFADGKYKEHILFFSRDNSRVGAALEFDGEIDEGDWHHKGKSSKGVLLHEVWTRL